MNFKTIVERIICFERNRQNKNYFVSNPIDLLTLGNINAIRIHLIKD